MHYLLSLFKMFTLIFIVSIGATMAEVTEGKEDLYLSIREVAASHAALNLEGELIARSLDTGEATKIIVVADKLIALGTKVWDIIVSGRPNVELTFAKPISVLSQDGATSNAAFYEMEGWSMPIVKTFIVEAKNAFGQVRGSFKYNIVFQAGGHVGGVGRYITGLYINASEVVGKWGSSLAATSEFMSISNIGTLDNPIATATLRLEYAYSSAFKTIQVSRLFYITGEGKFIKLQ